MKLSSNRLQGVLLRVGGLYVTLMVVILIHERFGMSATLPALVLVAGEILGIAFRNHAP